MRYSGISWIFNFYQHFIQRFNQIAIPLTSILQTIGIDLSALNLKSADDNNTIDKIDNNEIVKAKISAKMAKSKSHDKSKGKNLVNSFLIKSQASIPGSKLGFLTRKARKAFIKLK